MRRASTWIVLTVTLWAASRAHAQHIGVFPVHGTNLTPSESAAIGALFSSAYAERAHLSVLSPTELAPYLAEAGSETRAAELAGLYEYLHVEAVRLATRIVLTAQLRDVYGRGLYEARDTAFSLDDMELVSLRMAAALVQRAPVQSRGGGPAPGQAERPKRLYAEKLFGVRFAVVMPVARHLETQASLLSQFDVRLERGHYFIELAAGFWLPSETNTRQGLGGWVGQLGGSYYLARESVSPYIGLGISPRWFAWEFRGAGLAINAHVGVMFMRELSTRMYAELRVDQNLMRPHQRAGSEDSSGSRDVLPTELSAAVGLGF